MIDQQRPWLGAYELQFKVKRNRTVTILGFNNAGMAMDATLDRMKDKHHYDAIRLLSPDKKALVMYGDMGAFSILR